MVDSTLNRGYNITMNNIKKDIEMLQGTTELWITDKTGKESFKTLCSTEYHTSELRNLQQHVDYAKKRPELYNFLDVNSMEIVVRHADEQKSDEELLAELMS